MAIRAMVTVEGDLELEGAYIRVTAAQIMSLTTAEGERAWVMAYDIEAYKDERARAREAAVPLAGGRHFKTACNLDANPIAASYADLKERYPDAVDC